MAGPHDALAARFQQCGAPGQLRAHRGPRGARRVQSGAGGAAAKKAVFLHNPADPYLSRDDVLATVGAAERLGLEADVHEVATNHVQTIFQKPRLIFEGALA